jgi:hypothetical protein
MIVVETLPFSKDFGGHLDTTLAHWLSDLLYLLSFGLLDLYLSMLIKSLGNYHLIIKLLNASAVL